MTKKLIIVAIALVVGGLHFVTGPGYRGPFPIFVNGYMIDVLLPFSMYLVIGLVEHPLARSRIVRAAFVFGFGAVTETLQYFGIPVFGSTFDWLDYVMFGTGVGLAALFEVAVLEKLPASDTSAKI